MKIYVASSWRNIYQESVVRILKEQDYEVYDFKHPEPGDNGFHWNEIDPEWKLWSPDKFIKGLGHKIAIKGFTYDANALESCDVCVLVLPCGRSAHLEAGYVLGRGKPTLIYIPEPCEPELMYNLVYNHHGIITSTLSDILEWLKEHSDRNMP